jgi:hypothetical protein
VLTTTFATDTAFASIDLRVASGARSSYSRGTPTVRLADLAPGASVRVTVTVRLTRSLSSVSNRVTLTSTSTDTNLANNTDTDVVTIR